MGFILLILSIDVNKGVVKFYMDMQDGQDRERKF